MFDELMEVKEEDIEINFIMDGEEYVVLKNNEDTDDVYIGQVVSIDDEYETIASVSDEKYERALDEYISILEEMEANLEDEN